MEGLTWLWTRPVLRRLALSLGVINGLHMLAMVVLVLVSQERLGLSASGFGVLLAMGAEAVWSVGLSTPPSCGGSVRNVAAHYPSPCFPRHS
jgi:hypothetical protein